LFVQFVTAGMHS